MKDGFTKLALILDPVRFPGVNREATVAGGTRRRAGHQERQCGKSELELILDRASPQCLFHTGRGGAGVGVGRCDPSGRQAPWPAPPRRR